MLKLRRVRAAVAIFKSGSALKAAEHLHMSQSSVTEAIGQLETELGEGLFERSSRGMRATRPGAAFCERASAALNQLQNAEVQLRKRSYMRQGRPWHRLVNEGQLEALIALVQCGSFTLAGRQLSLSQPAVHRAARELQELSGLELWRRAPAGIEATADAVILARSAALCFRTMEQAIEDLREQRGLFNGRLNVGALPLARTKWVPDAVRATLARFPDAKVRIVDGPYSDLSIALQHGEIDVIVGALRADGRHSGIVQTGIFTDKLSIIVGAQHPLAGKPDAALEVADMLNLRWILPRQDTPGRQSFDRVFLYAGLVPPEASIECSSLAAVRGLLLDGEHATPLSTSQVDLELKMGLLVALGPELDETERTIGLAERKDFVPTQLFSEFRRQLSMVRAPCGSTIEF